MKTINRVILLGTYKEDDKHPTISISAEGALSAQQTTFHLVTQHARKRGDDTWTEEAHWHKCRVRGVLNERFTKSVKVGQALLVEGRLANNVVDTTEIVYLPRECA